MKRRRCPYCGKKTSTYDNFCDKDCKTNFERISKDIEKKTPIFITILVISCILSFIGIIVLPINKTIGYPIFTLSFLGMFGTMLVMPFATPETTELLGIKKSMFLVRLLALVILISIGITIII